MKLIAEALACERNGRVVFSNVSFELQAGQCMELRGANGAGKSSLLRLVAGLVPKAAGTIALGGKEFHTLLHFIAHQDAMKAALTVSENLTFWCKALGGTDIEAALSAFQLEALRHDVVQLLSAGQRRRLTLARLFLTSRPLWLLDEPMTALDVTSQETLRQHMKRHLKEGGMVIAATHGDLGLEPDHTLSLSST